MNAVTDNRTVKNIDELVDTDPKLLTTLKVEE